MKISSDLAIEVLKGGEVVALPTETVYGLAASVSSESAIKKIFFFKRRPLDNPLIVHIGEKEQILPLVRDLPPGAEALMEALWPGPLTLVLPAGEVVSRAITAGLDTVAVRMPSHSIMRHIVREAGPIVAPSANISGYPSATTAGHVLEDFGDQIPVVDGGPCVHGLESTILVWEEGRWVVGRLGAMPAEEIGSSLGYVPQVRERGSGVVCPGSRYRHYAPRCELVLGGEEDVVLGFEGRVYPGVRRVITLGSLDQPQKVAMGLYSALRELDACGYRRAAVDMVFPTEGIWRTIRERLTRAATRDQKTHIHGESHG